MFRSFSPSLVGIETKNHLIDEALENSGLLFGEGCALRRDHVFNARFKQRDQIELAFAHDSAICFNQRSLCFVQSKKHAPLLEKRGVRGIQIFGGMGDGLEQPAAERNYLADVVANRKYDAAAKTIVDFVARAIFIARLHQSALQQLAARIAVVERPFQKCIPTVRRKTKLAILCDLFVDSTIFQVVAGCFPERFFQKIFLEPLRRLGKELEQRPSRFMLSIFIRGGAFLDNRNAHTCRQSSHGRWKIEMFVFHHEPENASADSAAKAMKRLTLRTDVKRRRFFLVKRTERLEISAGPFQRKIRADHLDDVVGGRDLLYGF